MGTPTYDAQKRITNGVLIMHGSSGDASQVLAPSMIGPLTVPGGALDPARYYLIFPDILGAGKSTKPSDGLRAKFPRYGYGDLVDLEYRLVTEHFRIQRLRLVMGISMGGMHTWMWGIRYPDMMDGLVPISSLPSKIDGRNLLWRRILSNAIRTDPEWNGGNYRLAAARVPEHHADVRHAGAEPGAAERAAGHLSRRPTRTSKRWSKKRLKRTTPTTSSIGSRRRSTTTRSPSSARLPRRCS